MKKYTLDICEKDGYKMFMYRNDYWIIPDEVLSGEQTELFIGEYPFYGVSTKNVFIDDACKHISFTIG